VDYPQVKAVNPRIIYCSITGYGQNGPYRDRVGHDVNYLANAGVLDLIGEPDRPPAIPGVQIADIAGGGMNAAIGILLALFAREKTGKGQYIDISMTDGMVGLHPAVLFFYQQTGRVPRRSDGLLSHRYACYNTYETADGRYISIGAVEHRFWKKLCEVLDLPEYASLQYDETRRQEITDRVRAIFRQKALTEWETVLGDQDICWGCVQSLAEVLDDPLFRKREMVIDLQQKNGRTLKAIGVPVKLSETAGSIRTPPPDFGEHTSAILSELGYSEEDIARLMQQEVI
jgi:crotonobetainyl-CoA:carnitine CoA-transferase CaiB-like acyl-CoA transferase